MKFARIGEPHNERPGILDGDRIVDISSLVEDLTPDTLTQLEAIANASKDLPTLPDGRFGPPITGVGKIVCVGINYRDHAVESGLEPTTELPLFLKAPDTIIGPNDVVQVPPGSTTTDYEVELAMVIGKTARYLTDADDPLSYVAGFSISNDVSERSFQLERGGQWDKGKNCPTFNPLGPWLVTPEALDIDNLELTCSVNGIQRQQSNTEHMIMSPQDLLVYITQFMTLYPGDIVNTGTPEGVALGHPEPKPYLQPGDVMELTISGLGTQRQSLAETRL